MKIKSWQIILAIIIMYSILLLSNSKCFAQRNIGPDTIPVIIYYSDTVCRFNSDEVASIYNSGCQKETRGYIVLWMYYTEILWFDKKPLPKTINYWFYKPIDTIPKKIKNDWGTFSPM